ncbi:IS4 family transposase [Shewanella benthica]|nr:IS4 family transposase [Shewanella benthica]
MSIFNAEEWAKSHFQHAKLGDIRRADRLVSTAANMARSSGKSIALSCRGNEAELEGAYRLIRNDNVSPDMIRVAGFQHTAKEAVSVAEILALEDTTSLSYKHQVAADLGKLGQKTDRSRGWWVHSVMLLDSHTTRTIGLIHQDWWCRPNHPEAADEKESGKWPDASHFCRERLGETMSRVISVNVIYAQEKASATVTEPLRWILLTTEPIETLKQALHVIDIYAARWRVEDFHKAWKTGAGAERQRMTEPQNLERAASILAFIGVRLLQLRETITLPYYLRKKGLVGEALSLEEQGCDTVFVRDEWKLLMRHYKPRGYKGKSAPSMKWAYISLAKLGGFTNTKGTGIASWSTIWEGWDQLQAQVAGYRAAKEMLAAGEEL